MDKSVVTPGKVPENAGGWLSSSVVNCCTMARQNCFRRTLFPTAVGVIAAPNHEEGDKDRQGAKRILQSD
jgi:hypothetical protein